MFNEITILTVLYIYTFHLEIIRYLLVLFGDKSHPLDDVIKSAASNIWEIWFNEQEWAPRAGLIFLYINEQQQGKVSDY